MSDGEIADLLVIERMRPLSRLTHLIDRDECHDTRELNLETLVWTRGRKMLLSNLKDRMMCPQCGGRRISIIFDPKPTVRAQAV